MKDKNQWHVYTKAIISTKKTVFSLINCWNENKKNGNHFKWKKKIVLKEARHQFLRK